MNKVLILEEYHTVSAPSMFTFFLVIVFFVSILAFGGGHSQNSQDFTKFIRKNYFHKLWAVFSILKHMCSNVTDRKKKTCLKGSSTLDRFWLGWLTEMVLNPADVLEMAFFGWASTAWFQRACLAAPVWAVVTTTGGGRGADTGDPQWPSASFRLGHHDEVLHPVRICKYTQPRSRRLCIHTEQLSALLLFKSLISRKSTIYD